MTEPLLDLLAVLVRADGELHGWELMKRSGRSGPTVYQTLDRLRTSNWVTCHWEQLGAHENRPRRRFYALTSEGSRLAKMLLAERRPSHADEHADRAPFPALGTISPDGAM